MRQPLGSAGADVNQVGVILDDARHHLEIGHAARKRIGYGFEHEGRDRFGILEMPLDLFPVQNAFPGTLIGGRWKIIQDEIQQQIGPDVVQARGA